MSRGPDIGTVTVRMIEAAGRAHGCPATVVESEWERWSSATFTGARHCITLAATPSHALDLWLAGLSEETFELRGHLVADVAVVAVKRSAEQVIAEIEVLTVEDR